MQVSGVRRERDTGGTARWKNKAAVDPSVLAHSRHIVSTLGKRQMQWRIVTDKLRLGTIRQGTTAKSLLLMIPVVIQ